jgi:NTP pyrophosphatase (non-canonical NTP hydrolase)
MIDYLLACLGEECGEVQQVVGKALRFGLYGKNLSGGRTLIDLVNEMHDIMAVWDLLLDKIDEDGLYFQPSQLMAKKQKVLKYSDLDYYTE